MKKLSLFSFILFFTVSCKNDDKIPRYETKNTNTSTKKENKETKFSNLSWGEFLEEMKNKNAILKFNQELSDSPHQAFLFECSPIRYDKLDEIKFEYTLTSDKSLDNKAANPNAFSKQINKAHKKGGRSTHFLNLGKNARLIIPSNLDKNSDIKQFTHIARFVREASNENIISFWKMVFTSLESELQKRHKKNSNQWTWLNTHGHGVPWLHMRIDSRPKYYSHTPYKTPPQ